MTEITEEAADRELRLTVHDEDDGSVFHIKGEAEGTVAVVVHKLYSEHLHRDRLSGDRLRCDANGDDVFEHLEEQLRNYRKTHCHQLVWNFVGDQGGAGGDPATN
jgi:hypothetical protein